MCSFSQAVSAVDRFKDHSRPRDCAADKPHALLVNRVLFFKYIPHSYLSPGNL